MLEMVEPLAPLLEERRLFYFLAAADRNPPRSSAKESIEI